MVDQSQETEKFQDLLMNTLSLEQTPPPAHVFYEDQPQPGQTSYHEFGAQEDESDYPYDQIEAVDEEGEIVMEEEPSTSNQPPTPQTEVLAE